MPGVSTASSSPDVYTGDSITKGEQWMVRRMICSLFVAAMLLPLGIRANAAEDSGSIRIWLDVGDLATTKGEITLHRVGTKVSDGYRIADAYGGGIVKDADATSPHLAQWLAETAGSGGRSLALDADGCAEFDDLEEGLYLVVQTERMDGFYTIKPFLMTLPCEGQWNVLASPKVQPIVAELPQTGQDPLPFLGILGMALSGTGLLLCRKRRK